MTKRTIRSIGRSRALPFLAAAWVAACSRGGAGAASGELRRLEDFSCRLPAAWVAETSGGAPIGVFRRQDSTIRATRYGPGTMFPTPARFEATLRSSGVPLEDAGSADVDGRSVPILRLRYRPDARPEEAPAGAARPVLEEVAVVPAGRGFWVLRFSTPDSDVPDWEPDWKGFLASFQIKS